MFVIDRKHAVICLLLLSLSVFNNKVAASVKPPINTRIFNDSLPSVDTANMDVKYYRLNRVYLRSYWPSFKKVVTSPARWTGRDWVVFGSIVGAGALVSVADLDIRNMVQRNRSAFANSVSDFFEPFGNNYPPLILTSLYITSVIAKDRKLEHATLMATKSFLISTLFYTLTKATIRRQRPLRAEGQYEFQAPFSKTNSTSFPSGHSNTVFSIATAMAIEYSHKKWVPIVCYSLATVVAFSRVYENRHWASDVIFGASIGHFVTKAIYAKEKKRTRKPL